MKLRKPHCSTSGFYDAVDGFCGSVEGAVGVEVDQDRGLPWTWFSGSPDQGTVRRLDHISRIGRPKHGMS